MVAVARETSVPDTGFVIREELPDADFRLRWFTPTVEVDLCGHATLASAHCLFEDGVRGPIRFATRSGVLTVNQRQDGSLAMDFPTWPPTEVEARSAVAEALGGPVEWTGLTDNGVFLLVLVADERSVRDLIPDLTAISRLDGSALIVTAVADPGQGYDFVSRIFAPDLGIPEDPVTGSAHTVLAPFWADRLGRTSLVGFQASSSAAVCARTELPVAWRVETARAHESSLADDLLRRVRARKFQPETAALDRGYDVNPVYEACDRAGVLPIIPLRKTPTVKRGEHRAPECEHGVWTFAGADVKRQRTKWRCPTGECQPASIWRKVSRLHPLVPRETKRWGDLYRGRGAVERTFGRLKNEYGLKPLRVRGLAQVQLHADLTCLAALTLALTRARAIPLAA